MKIGFLGCGKMATALAGGVVDAGVCQPHDLLVYDLHPGAVDALAKKTGAVPVSGREELAAKADLLLLCVKPGDALGALAGLASALTGKTLVSIAAGISIRQLESAAGPATRVVRVMPNTPALIGRGAAAFALGTSATAEDAERARRIFSAV